MKTLVDVLAEDGVCKDLHSILLALTHATQYLSARIALGALGGILGSAEKQNIQGETQQALDVLANNLIKAALQELPTVAALVSEEEAGVVPCHANGSYVVAFDPLDGSSNIDVNGQIGTIFTVYKRLSEFDHHSEQQFLRPGSQQVCAGYVLYGPSTQLVLCCSGPTRSFTLLNKYPKDSAKTPTPLDAQSDYVLVDEVLTLPIKTSEFAINMAHQAGWDEGVKRYIGDLLHGRSESFNMRWSGAMVGDVHRILLRGGIFLYPLNHNSHRKAKLRLLYEAAPMAMLIEGAGGLAYSQSIPILDIAPASLHQRLDVILGSVSEVERYLSYIMPSSTLP